MSFDEADRSRRTRSASLERFSGDTGVERLLRAYTLTVLIVLPALMLVVGTGSTEIFAITALLGFVCWLRRRQNGLRRLGRLEAIAAAGCLAFVATVLLSLALQGAPYHAIRELDTLLRPLLAIPLMHLMIRTRPTSDVLWAAMALGAVAVGINALVTVGAAGEFVRVWGGLGPNAYGMLSITAGFIAAIGLTWRGRPGKSRVALELLVLILGLIGGLLSGSRGAWTALPALVLLLGWHHWRQGFRYYAVGGGMAIALVSMIAYAIPQSGVQQRLGHAVSEVDRYFEDPAEHGGTPVGQRFEMWRAGWAMFLDHPITGGGIGQSFNQDVRQGVEAGLYHPAIRNQDKLHNAYLEVLATRGLIGLVGFVTFLGAFAYIYGRAALAHEPRLRALGLSGLTLLAAYIILGLTNSIFDYGKPMLFFVTYAALIVYLVGDSFENHEKGTSARSDMDGMEKT